MFTPISPKRFAQDHHTCWTKCERSAEFVLDSASPVIILRRFCHVVRVLKHTLQRLSLIVMHWRLDGIVPRPWYRTREGRRRLNTLKLRVPSRYGVVAMELPNGKSFILDQM